MEIRVHSIQMTGQAQGTSNHAERPASGPKATARPNAIPVHFIARYIRDRAGVYKGS